MLMLMLMLTPAPFVMVDGSSEVMETDSLIVVDVVEDEVIEELELPETSVI